MSASGLAPPPGLASALPTNDAPDGAGRPPNVFVVVLDCGRHKSFGLSGLEDVARTPVLDALARRGTVFPRAVAPSNWTIPSHMSIFTGSYPSRHGLRTFRRDAATLPTVAEGLRARGYETALFTEMVHLAAGYGLENGYDRVYARRKGVSDEERTLANRIAAHSDVLYSEGVRRMIERIPASVVALNAVNHPQEVAFKRDVCGEYLLGDFDRWLGGRDGERPFHAFVNLVDAHEPYPIVPNGHRASFLEKWYARTPRYYLLAVPGLQELVPWGELLRGYHAEIARADAKVGRFLEALERHGELDRTLVIVTADHGQSFGEDGNVFHGCGATDSIARVPLIVAPPSELSLPSHVDRWTSLCEVAGWVVSAAGGRPPYDEDGCPPSRGDPAPSPQIVYCEGAPASDPNRSLLGIGRDRRWNHRLLAAYRDDEKFILDLETGEVARWSMRRDPDGARAERFVGGEAVELRRELFAPYESTGVATERSAPAPGVDAELDKRLRSWGYD